MDETQEKLLRERGVIVLPQDIEHATYVDVLSLLLLAETEWADKPIRLYCAGDGGSAPAAISIVDLVQQHGNVIGMLAGEATSSHVTVFAGCPERYVYPNASIGVHRLAWPDVGTRQDRVSLDNRAAELQIGEAKVASILAKASCKDEDWWLSEMRSAGSDGVRIFTTTDIISLGLAQHVSEYPPRGMHSVTLSQKGEVVPVIKSETAVESVNGTPDRACGKCGKILVGDAAAINKAKPGEMFCSAVCADEF